MTDSNTPEPVSIGLDDGYAYTKLALPDGRLLAVPSRARHGHAGVTWLDPAKACALEYETADSVYAVGDLDGDGRAEFRLTVTGLADLTAADFFSADRGDTGRWIRGPGRCVNGLQPAQSG